MQTQSIPEFMEKLQYSDWGGLSSLVMQNTCIRYTSTYNKFENEEKK